MSSQEPTDHELRAAYEEQIKQIRVEDILMENVVTLINLGMRRTGLMQGTESERDPEQVRVAVEGVRALMPLIASAAPEQVGPLRQALSQLQLAYVQIGGGGAPESSAGAYDSGSGAGPGPSAPSGGSGTPETEPAGAGGVESPATQPDEPGPAQRSGRLWVPGQ